MTVIVLLGAPGAGKGTQAASWPSASASPTSRPATCSGPPSATARRSGSRRAATWSAASSCPTTSRSDAPRPARGQPMRVGGAILDGFPRNRRPGRGARRRARASAGSRVDRAIVHRRRRPTSSSAGCRAAGSASDDRPRLQRAHQPAARAGRLRPRRLAARPARRRPGRDHPGPAGRPARPPCTRSSTTTRRGRAARPSTAPADRATSASALADGRRSRAAGAAGAAG